MYLLSNMVSLSYFMLFWVSMSVFGGVAQGYQQKSAYCGWGYDWELGDFFHDHGFVDINSTRMTT